MPKRYATKEILAEGRRLLEEWRRIDREHQDGGSEYDWYDGAATKRFDKHAGNHFEAMANMIDLMEWALRRDVMLTCPSDSPSVVGFTATDRRGLGWTEGKTMIEALAALRERENDKEN